MQTSGSRSFSLDASYLYNGTLAQSTGTALPAQVRNLTTTNANPVTLTQPVRVAQVLTIGGSGNLALNGQALTLLSDATGTALAVNSGTGLVTGGTATVQRYLTPTNPGFGYRHYSSPVGGNSLANLATGTFTPVFNAAYNSATAPANVRPFPTVFGYDQSRIGTVTNNYSAFDKGWYAPATGAGNTPAAFAAGQGYAVQLRGTERVALTGTLHSGDYALPLARNAGPTAPDAGWALVGNPYPAPIDWDRVAAADRNGLDASMYVFESSGPYVGTYRTNVNNIGSSSLIGSSQGFFVRVSQGQTSGTLTFRNGQRLTDFATQATVRRGPADPRPQVQLQLAGSGGADDLFVYAEAGATAGADAAFDAVKLPNPNGLNLSATAATGEALAIQGLPLLTSATVVPLAVGVPAAGTYALLAPALLNVPASTQVFLLDALTGQRVDLRTLPASGYAFPLTTAQAATALTGRFFLNLVPAGATLASVAAQAAGGQLYPNPAHGTATLHLPAGADRQPLALLDALGREVRRYPAPTGNEATLDLRGLAPGVYVLRGGAGSQRLVVE